SKMRQWPSSHQSKQPATWRYTLKRKLRGARDLCLLARQSDELQSWRHAAAGHPRDLGGGTSLRTTLLADGVQPGREGHAHVAGAHLADAVAAGEVRCD